MHGTSGQYRLDMKRDDARTLMLKMDARLTYAGRERNVALQIEGERQKKHIEWQRQLNEADFKRQEKDVRRRMEFFQSLLEENRLERQTTLTDMNVFETEIEADREASRRGRRRLPPVRRKVQNLDRAENVGSVRREQQTFTNNRAHQRYLNRSLNELNKSYKKQQTQKELNETKLMKIREEMATIGRPKPSKEATQPILEDLPELQASIGEPRQSISRKQTQHLTKSLPLPKVQEEQLTPQGRRLSRSQRIPGEELDTLNKLPGITVSGGRGSRLGGKSSNLGSNFYIDTSHSESVYKRRGSIRLVTLNKPKVKTKKDKPKPKTGLLMPGHTALPSKFYEGVYEENPFLTPDFKPEAVKSRANSSKSDQMYAWLGLDSMEDLVLLRGEEAIGVGKDIDDDDDMEWVEVASNVEESNQDISGTGDNTERKEKRVYTLGKPVDFDTVKASPLKKFARVAKSIMLVRQLQDSAGCLPETADVIIRKNTDNETPAAETQETIEGTVQAEENKETDKQTEEVQTKTSDVEAKTEDVETKTEDVEAKTENGDTEQIE
ncbi:uncharacterized protein [Amphiura filiformis]|uniref:uncharacterized protein n=1 Tax=Amphiura filiformis TaxID=82378 RepID=UPI003B225629